MENQYLIKCPHCKGSIMIQKDEINCKIFRHGVDINGFTINPHLPKDQCIILRINNPKLGCYKPFMFDGTKVSKCDYI